MGVDFLKCEKCEEIVTYDYALNMDNCPICKGYTICHECVFHEDNCFVEDSQFFDWYLEENDINYKDVKGDEKLKEKVEQIQKEEINKHVCCSVCSYKKAKRRRMEEELRNEILKNHPCDACKVREEKNKLRAEKRKLKINK
jgi:hypothetical protein